MKQGGIGLAYAGAHLDVHSLASLVEREYYLSTPKGVEPSCDPLGVNRKGIVAAVRYSVCCFASNCATAESTPASISAAMYSAWYSVTVVPVKRCPFGSM